jgi:hypothetical protein
MNSLNFSLACRIACPKCERRAEVTLPIAAASEGSTRNDFSVPDDFRMVQPAWNSSQVHFYCVHCGVAATHDLLE